MKRFFFLTLCLLSGCSILSDPIDLKNPADAMILVTIQMPDQSILTKSIPNFSPLSVLLQQIECKTCDFTQLNPSMILKDGDLIILKEVSGLTVSINQAMLDELIFLPGIGPSLAQRIIDYRNTIGFFQKIEDIMHVKGIKQGLFNKIKMYLSL